MAQGQMGTHPKASKSLSFFVTLCLALTLTACTAENIKKRYILAEKLWGDGDYTQAVAEFEKVIRRDPQGTLGRQALFRAATTQALFLSQYREAISKFKTYLEASPASSESWSAELQIGDILYSKLGSYTEAILYYRGLLEKKPQTAEAPEFLFRMGKSHFFLWEFSEAIEQYQKVMSQFPESPWAERAAYEVGTAFFTSGEQKPEGNKAALEAYKMAMKAYDDFMKKYPKSSFVPEAQFGIANCLEEMDQLDAAQQKYETLVKTYPDPKVVAIKLARIRERQSLRRR
jgi:TolA-binding protein